jgi:hypothetical protein
MTPPLSPRRTVPASEAERSAYNAAFHELGLGWHWSADTFESLQARGTPCDRIRHYMEQQHPHLFAPTTPSSSPRRSPAGSPSCVGAMVLSVDRSTRRRATSAASRPRSHRSVSERIGAPAQPPVIERA